MVHPKSSIMVLVSIESAYATSY